MRRIPPTASLLLVATLLTVASACGYVGGETTEPVAPKPDRPQLQVGPAPGGGGADGGGAGGSPPEGAIVAEDCENLSPSPQVPAGEYLTGRLQCGDVITAHTAGGVRLLDTKFYERNHCTPATTNHDGGDERFYELRVPDGDKTVDVWLETPCANLDLGALRVNGDGPPSADLALEQCEMWPKPGNKREHVHLVSKTATRWLIVVEGQGDEEGGYTISVQCQDGLK